MLLWIKQIADNQWNTEWVKPYYIMREYKENKLIFMKIIILYKKESKPIQLRPI